MIDVKNQLLKKKKCLPKSHHTEWVTWVHISSVKYNYNNGESDPVTALQGNEPQPFQTNGRVISRRIKQLPISPHTFQGLGGGSVVASLMEGQLRRWQWSTPLEGNLVGRESGLATSVRYEHRATGLGTARLAGRPRQRSAKSVNTSTQTLLSIAVLCCGWLNKNWISRRSLRRRTLSQAGAATSLRKLASDGVAVQTVATSAIFPVGRMSVDGAKWLQHWQPATGSTKSGITNTNTLCTAPRGHRPSSWRDSCRSTPMFFFVGRSNTCTRLVLYTFGAWLNTVLEVECAEWQSLRTEVCGASSQS